MTRITGYVDGVCAYDETVPSNTPCVLLDEIADNVEGMLMLQAELELEAYGFVVLVFIKEEEEV